MDLREIIVFLIVGVVIAIIHNLIFGDVDISSWTAGILAWIIAEEIS